MPLIAKSINQINQYSKCVIGGSQIKLLKTVLDKYKQSLFCAAMKHKYTIFRIAEALVSFDCGYLFVVVVATLVKDVKYIITSTHLLSADCFQDCLSQSSSCRYSKLINC